MNAVISERYHIAVKLATLEPSSRKQSRRVRRHQQATGLGPVGADSDGTSSGTQVDLGFIARESRRNLRTGRKNDVAGRGPTAIAPRQDGGAVPATLQLIGEIVGESSLPRPADGDAANADHGKRQPLLTRLVAPGSEITPPGPQPGGRTENEPGEQTMRSFRIGSPIERPQLLRNALRRTLLVLNEQCADAPCFAPCRDPGTGRTRFARVLQPRPLEPWRRHPADRVRWPQNFPCAGR